MRNALVTAMLALFSGVVAAQAVTHGIPVPNGFYKGNAYRELSQLERERYVAGVIDGFIGAPLIAQANVPMSGKLQQCGLQLGLDTAQATAIVDMWVSQHPEQWGYGASYIVLTAITDACKKTGNPIR